jgi:DNA-binding transcriptional ArsR family regulator/uncharacterized protein YjbJ (UPF0337 family)
MRAILLLSLLLVVSAGAQVNETVGDVEEAAGNATNVVGDVLEGVGEATGDLGETVGEAGKSLSAGIGSLAKAIGKAIGATMDGLGFIGSGAALGLGTAFLWFSGAFANLFTGVGTAFGTTLTWTTLGIGQAFIAVGGLIGTINGLYWGFVSNLRPEEMPYAAYAAVTYTGAGATASAGTWAGWQLLRKWGIAGPVGIAGFTRINNDQLLEHPVRQQIYETIGTTPGIHASELAREVGIGWGTVSHHLEKLRKGNMVAARKVNNQNCFFHNGGAVGSTDMEVAGAVKGDNASRIAEFVHHHPMTSQKDMCEVLDMSPALASFHVKKLSNLGVLEKVRHGKSTLLTTSNAMRRVLDADSSIMSSWAAQADEGLQYRA